MQKYYQYVTGRYALVDIFYRNIWLNIPDESVAQQIRKTFFSKAGMIVYDLTFFKNWTESPPIIDSECCFDWKLPVVTVNERLVIQNLINDLLYKTQTSHESDLLVNEPSRTLLTDDRRRELQCQMMLYKSILEDTKLHVPIVQPNIFADKSIEQNQQRKFFLSQIDKIFSTELHIEQIENKLYKLAQEVFYQDFIFAAKILSHIGRLYA